MTYGYATVVLLHRRYNGLDVVVPFVQYLLSEPLQGSLHFLFTALLNEQLARLGQEVLYELLPFLYFCPPPFGHWLIARVSTTTSWEMMRFDRDRNIIIPTQEMLSTCSRAGR